MTGENREARRAAIYKKKRHVGKGSPTMQGKIKAKHTREKITNKQKGR